MTEVQELIFNWTLLFLSLIVALISVIAGLHWIVVAIWLTNAAIAGYGLIRAFMFHQKPHIPEYIEYYREQFELSMMSAPVRNKKIENE